MTANHTASTVNEQDHEVFFRHLLAGVTEPTAPFGLVGAAEAVPNCATLALEARLARRLRERAGALGVRAASLVHLAWAQVLAQVSARRDVLFGTVLFGPATAHSVGEPVNTLPVRVDVDGQSAADSVRQMDAQLRRLHQHAHAPAALVRRCSALAAALPLFSALLSYRRTSPTPDDAATTAAAAPGAAPFAPPPCPLLLEVHERDGEFVLTTQVSAPLPAERLAAYMLTALEQLLDALERAPDTPLRVMFDAAGAEPPAPPAPPAGPAGAGAPPSSARGAAATAPLSPMQERLWYREHMAPGRPTYNMPSAHRLRGKLDEAAFQLAFADMLRRQDALRTGVAVVDATPVQCIAAAPRADALPLEDLRGDVGGGADADAREEALRARIEALAAQPLELGEAPLFRARLWRTGDEEHVFYFAPHHIIWDGCCDAILEAEMAALYQARRSNTPCALREPPPAPPRARMNGEALAARLAHWRPRLDGTLEPLAVPTDRPRPAELSGRAAACRVAVAAAQVEAARALAGQAGASLSTAMLATYALSLHQLSGQAAVSIGVPVRARHDDAADTLMGMFAHVLPLRLSIDPQQSFMHLLGTVRDAVGDALAHADVPFDELARALGAPRDASRFPLYQASFSFQDARALAPRWGNLEHTPIEVAQPGLEQDLGLCLVERPDGLVGALNYSSDLLEAASGELLARRFEHLVGAVLAQPQAPLAQLPLAAHELRRLADYNATATAYPRDATIDALIAPQVRDGPQRTALSFGDASLSYRELDQRANRLANLLRARGIGRGQRVGLCVERGPAMVVAQLAVLKSGAAYVPFDPAYPVERLRFMARDAGLAALVSEAALGALLAWPRACSVLLDADAEAIAAAPDTPPPDDALAADADSVAYVIYTSGSTGKPKGVQVPQRAVVNFLTSMRDTPGMLAGDRLLAVTTLSFDIAVLELLLPLCVGAEIVLASREQALDAGALAQLLARSGATMLQATPGTWRMLLDSGWRGAPGFKALIGGEALPPDLAARLLAGGAQLWNMYGPTETTVWSSCWRVTPDAPAISIGRPIANTVIRILDEQRRPCPLGVPGEIWIGGDGVALGYLHRPALSAERFITDPFIGAGAPGGRLYGTGDRGRWRADGLLEHLGRNDFQVKVRGFRIELGEIEAALDAHPGVAHSVALAREDVPGDVRLVAYFAARGDAPDDAALRAHVRALLPNYMLPQHFVALERLPLLPNGKIDRKALPPPTIAAAAARGAAPHSATEQLLASIWSELLGSTGIGADDNFFDAGGHSLLAMQAILAMETRTGKRLNPRRFIFENLRQIARAYDEAAPDAVKPGMLNRLVSGLLGKAAR
ncbi:amino acid adenylation domain-containing protein [Janthinobacterium sp. CG_23.3]|uniref:non-ribosomal peptide synthetase n=1 Tax=Janthinobacterium sp. CG_23.3 TaxID=3349634 RepID=UPI0038D4120F